MFEVRGTTGVSISGKDASYFMLTTSDGIVTDPGRLHPCVGRPS